MLSDPSKHQSINFNKVIEPGHQRLPSTYSKAPIIGTGHSAVFAVWRWSKAESFSIIETYDYPLICVRGCSQTTFTRGGG